MNTIQELIDKGECVLGKTCLAGRYSSFTPYFFCHALSLWYGLSFEDAGISFLELDDIFSVYKEPVEMEDRWQWTDYQGTYVTTFYAQPPKDWPNRIDNSKKSFPKED
jgi:hypothetical protein